jgi:hypothetical protein
MQLEQGDYLLFIHSPFCGTCHVARSMLEKIESIHREDIFNEMNASLYPEFMQDCQVESVPCLLIVEESVIKEKLYAFRSVANIYHYLLTYKSSLFAKN